MATTSRSVGYRYELLDIAGTHKKDLNTVADASIQFDGDSAVKRTGSLTMKQDPDVDHLTDQIKIWFQEYDLSTDVVTESPLGVYKFLAPEREINRRLVTRKFQLYDNTQVLQDNPVIKTGTFANGTDGNAVATNTDTASAIQWVVQAAGIVTPDIYTGQQLGYVNVAPNGTRFPVAKTWDIGTSRLEVVNYILNDVMGYFELYTDMNGVFTTGPIPKLEFATPDFYYATDDKSIFLDPMNDKFDVNRIWNKVLIIGENPNSDIKLTATYTNDRADSPVSTTNLGRVIHAPIINAQDIETQPQLNEIARIRLQQGAELYQILEFETAVNPEHVAFNIIDIAYDVPEDDPISGTFIERSYSIDCKPGGRMRHTLHRIVPTEPVI